LDRRPGGFVEWTMDGSFDVHLDGGQRGTSGNEWQALTAGLPQRDCYVNVLRDAMAVDSLDPCGVYFGTTGGQVYVSADSAVQWSLRILARTGREVELDVEGPATTHAGGPTDRVIAQRPQVEGDDP
jgi:hypothetical protein